MTGLTTHVLDLTQGKPADALEISFYTTQSDRKESVSYTHLTLPTNREV